MRNRIRSAIALFVLLALPVHGGRLPLYIIGNGQSQIVDARDVGATISVMTDEGAAAAGLLTCSGNPADAQQIVFGAKTYDIENDALNADGEIDLGADGDITLSNIFAALTLGAGSGTAYAAAMTANASVTASSPIEVATATGTLTLAGVGNDTGAAVIGARTYTLQTVLTDVDGNVLIGATAEDTADNIVAAITLGAGAGTLYAESTTANVQVTASDGALATVVVTALDPGCGENAIATTTDITGGSWGAATLTGGTSTMAVSAIIGGTAGNSLATTDTATGLGFGAATLTGGTDVTATIEYVVDDGGSGTVGPPVGSITVTDTAGGKVELVTAWPVVKVTSSGGNTFATAH